MCAPAQVQGSLLLASLVQITLGATGCIGVLVRHIGPLTIAPLMLMLSLSVVHICVHKMAVQPVIALA